jgi:hypothetical protein
MKRKIGYFGTFGLALLVLSLVLAGCDNGTTSNSPTGTAYSVSADGTANTTATTALTLTFESTVSGLSADDITLTNDGGAAAKGTLTGSGTIWTLGVTTTKAGNVKVKITKDGIAGNDHPVTVHYPGSNPPGGGGGSELSITGISDAPPIRYYVAGQTPLPIGGKIFAVAAEKPPSPILDISPDGYKGVPSQTGTMKFKVFVYDINNYLTPASEFTGSVTIPKGEFTFWYGTTEMINPDNGESCKTKADIVFTNGKGEITYANSGLADD